MFIQRIITLFIKDLRYGSRNVVFLMAIGLPLILSLVISLLFGSLFSETPKFGVYDVADSALGQGLMDADFMRVSAYDNEAALMTALENGDLEVGLIIPADADLSTGAGLRVLVWGQSLAQNRAIIISAITDQLITLNARETPVTLNTVLVGDRAAMSWQQRLLPLVVLMSVVIGGVMVPSSSIVEEKRGRTLTALTITPMSLLEVFIVKGLMGVLLAIFSGVAILSLNGGWGNSPVLLILVLIMGGMVASTFGILLGVMTNDINTLFATIKGMGILLYAPGIIAVFPESIPQWIAQLFPTYYIMQPVMDISQGGATLGDILPHLLVLGVIMAVLVAILQLGTRRMVLKGI